MRRIKWMFNHFPAQAFKTEKLDEMFDEYVGLGEQDRLARAWFMTEDELKKMSGHGMEIGSHTETHPALDVTGLADIETELTISRRALSALLGGMEIESFAWTFGGVFRPRALQMARGLYQSAWNFHSALKEMPCNPYYDLCNIPRIHEQAYLPGVTGK